MVLGMARTNITLYFKGKFFLRAQIAYPYYHLFPHRVICLKLEPGEQCRTSLVSCLPAILDHPPTSPGHGYFVSSYTSVSCHSKPTSTGTISIEPLPLWPGLSILLNFSILVITVSSIALKIIC